MADDILDNPQVTRFTGDRNLLIYEKPPTAVCYQLNQGDQCIQYTRAQAIRVALAILKDATDWPYHP